MPYTVGGVNCPLDHTLPPSPGGPALSAKPSMPWISNEETLTKSRNCHYKCSFRPEKKRKKLGTAPKKKFHFISFGPECPGKEYSEGHVCVLNYYCSNDDDDWKKIWLLIHLTSHISSFAGALKQQKTFHHLHIRRIWSGTFKNGRSEAHFDVYLNSRKIYLFVLLVVLRRLKRKSVFMGAKEEPGMSMWMLVSVF